MKSNVHRNLNCQCRTIYKQVYATYARNQSLKVNNQHQILRMIMSTSYMNWIPKYF